ncbi:Ig-like domain-containing protein [Aquimonas voraii]|uniref:Outer membrane protein OmpA n=1 Tax=Aquimonas voraii TaxID=265719 RepID=A0A1G6SIY7_9GAMM|nr:Ig-like domain-containing protein [Aquimonas voraii]SDD16819.1 Outer membrane protein OmpA [Aquimonas voraii]
MHRPMLLAALLTFASGVTQAQTAPPPAKGVVPITYVGSNGRIGVGINDDGDVNGEFLGFFAHRGHATGMVEGWYGQGGAGGLKLGWHWLWGGRTLDQVIADPSGASVAKVFAAVDRNVMGDRKASLGFGWERETWFGDLYVSAGLTDERLVDSRTRVDVSTITGTNATGRPFTQQRTLTTLTRVFEQAYDHGLGARFGRFFEEAQLRLQAGFDREWGDFSSHQNTFSLGVEKFIPGTGHSIGLSIEALRRAGDFVLDRSDTRGLLSWRYDFGGAQAYREVQPYRDVEVVTEVEVAGEPQLMRNEVGMDAATYFKLDRFSLQDADASQLDALLAALKSDSRVSRIRIVGHTCDLGRDAYNQGLSERRARAVAEFFASHGVSIEEMDVSGEGESDPRFPNDGEANRAKNRRVDVSFLSVEERSVPGETRIEKRSEWKREPVAAPPAWIERALRNPAAHKRAVDVYRFEETEQSEQLGPQVLVNRAPLAVNDSATVDRDASAASIAVLGNDSDPDGDTLTITTVSAPANGSATLSGSSVLYTPRAGFTGSDSFTYTISDGALTATATVDITVRIAPPVANPDTASTVRGTPVSFNVLSNDSDPAGEALSLVAVGTPSNGSASFVADGVVTYTPAAGFLGSDTFSYRARNVSGAEVEGRITVTVTAVPPRALSDVATTPYSTPITVNVLANDSDPSGDTLTLVEVTGARNGTVSFSADGSVTFSPDADFFGGVVTLGYRIRNTAGGEDTASLVITVSPPVGPIAVADEAFTPGITPVEIDVLANDSDPQNLAIRVVTVNRGFRGTTTLLPDGRVRYVPNDNWCGTDLFTYIIENSAGLRAATTVIVRRIAGSSASPGAQAKSCSIQ